MSPWVDDARAALLTDLYELTMCQAYWREGMDAPATFSLYSRRLPPGRSFLLAAGLDDALRFLETLHFDDAALAHLDTLGRFEPAFLDWLGRLRFTGEVRAVPEGTPVFAEEPLLEVTAPIAEAQLAETFLLNQVHLQTVVASKAARVVAAAAGRPVVDFGLRRYHGTDAGLKAARAAWLAGCVSTSNVLASAVWPEIPAAGTMAHSYVQAHDDELDAFRRFSELYPETTLLVDTYDTLRGVDRVIALARERGPAFRVGAVRLDSGDLGVLARAARRMLDAAGLAQVRIFASGELDEYTIAGLIAGGAPIDAFGVGTRMGVPPDAPTLDVAYKLVAYAGTGRVKLSTGKRSLPGQKQVFREERDGEAVRDVLAGADEELPGRPLLVPVMAAGVRTPAGRVGLSAVRAHAAEEIARLPARLRGVPPADPPYPVVVSERLMESFRAAQRRASEA